MIITGLGLTALAIALAWPVPRVLARARWPQRDPIAAIIVWQAIGLAGGLSLIGAPLIYALSPLDHHLPSSLAAFARQTLAGEPFAHLTAPHIAALAIAAALSAQLTIALAISALRTRRQRQQHRDSVALLARDDPDRPETIVIDHDRPAAYCVPGSPPLLVVTSGMRDTFAKGELDAVIAHEYAHLNYRHDILALPFMAWNQALPWIPSTAVARSSVSQLIEMMADDRASRTCDADTLAHAISLAAGSHSGPEHNEATRVARLTDPLPPLSMPGRALALMAAIALVAVPTVALAIV
ncbi:M56 family metallopeptidase [Natronoglycomyces albus]|uniref:M56 family metallopeptidase n=1 Tax=Natronoglycomyces albus TaxID=2811108 RepID=A0A895XTN9_9ACTN|nr:M56 family metallopeptidase [Natronoglycomyces albus]QSB06669.1 M56 family metallopeptidase [Natronoglycomyces albus]